ncbi:hypothetical protein [Nocardia sp. NPDC046763]|uniref:hypothetical protein n=1 Tax=Nocardia sp. NPDC046763 TaxID=3155256 RepID=UPI0033E6A7C5
MYLRQHFGGMCTCGLCQGRGGVELCGELEQHTAFSPELLDQAAAWYLTRVEDVVTLRCLNGNFRYRLTGEQVVGGLAAELITDAAG